MQNTHLSTLILMAGVGLAGCSSTPIDKASDSTAAAAAATNATTSAPRGPLAGAASAVASSTVAAVTVAPHLDPRSPISTARTVYFDYDVFTVGAEYVGLVERHARYLMAAPRLSIKVEGHADERGSPEYNLALGQKRAEAVVTALRLYGVKDARMEAVSWGEERPQAAGHDEEAWARNRHADLVYPGR